MLCQQWLHDIYITYIDHKKIRLSPAIIAEKRRFCNEKN